MYCCPRRNAEHPIVGFNYATVLQLASHREDVELVEASLAYGAAVDIRGEIVV
jgi:hypothetical protein